jgi:glycosyltransferase involved in cell wall biosynthesis
MHSKGRAAEEQLRAPRPPARHPMTASPLSAKDSPDMRQPSVSVIMPCYNAGAFLESAVQSVLQQDYTGPVELLVVDDGSTDESVQIASRFEGVKVLSQSNQGPAAARNLALDHATGQYVAFLDADDLWLPGSLRARIDVLEHDPEVAAVFANFSRWTPGNLAGETDLEVPDELPASLQDGIASGWLYPEILIDPIVHIITIVARREVFASVGRFDVALRLGEDYDFWIRASNRFRFRHLDVDAARYRMHATSTTRVPRSTNYEFEVVARAVKRYGLSGPRGIALNPKELDARLHQLCFKHGYLHFWHGEASIAAKSFRQSLRFQPSHLKAWAYTAAAMGRSVVAGLSARSRPQGAH